MTITIGYKKGTLQFTGIYLLNVYRRTNMAIWQDIEVPTRLLSLVFYKISSLIMPASTWFAGPNTLKITMQQLIIQHTFIRWQLPSMGSSLSPE